MAGMHSGLLVIDKEAGYTSHDVVAKLRRILGMKRIGHTGTLDPAAVGVLPVAFGPAARLTDLIADHTKTYEAVLRLGVVTDTQDMTGTILRTIDTLPEEREVLAVLRSFTGELLQVPPMYSARKIGGRKLYELARAGETVEREARPVQIYSLTADRVELPLVSFTVDCSKGTYIRTLCHDIGEALGCGGAMQALRRTRVGEFTIEESVSLAQVEEAVLEDRLETVAIPVERVLAHYPRMRCASQEDRLLLNGNGISQVMADEADPYRREGAAADGRVRMCTSEGIFIGLFEWNEDRKQFVPVKMLG